MQTEVLASLNRNEYLVARAGRYTITSRRKSVFSTFKKMFRSHKNREQVRVSGPLPSEEGTT